MKRLCNTTNKTISFKNWIKQHDPKMKWNFNDPNELTKQFVSVIKGSGDIDLKSIFYVMHSGLTVNQLVKFLETDY